MSNQSSKIFGGVLPLPVRQKAELRMAVQQVVEHPEMWAQGIQAIRDLLMQREEEAAWRVYDKFYSLFSSVEFRQQEEKNFQFRANNDSGSRRLCCECTTFYCGDDVGNFIQIFLYLGQVCKAAIVRCAGRVPNFAINP